MTLTIIAWLLCLGLIIKAIEMAAQGLHRQPDGGMSVGAIGIALCLIGAVSFAVLTWFAVPRDSVRATLPAATTGSALPAPPPVGTPQPATTGLADAPASLSSSAEIEQFDERALVDCLENAETAAEVEAC